MTHVIDHKAKDAAEQECYENIIQTVPQPGYCNATWDEMLCWDQTPPGSVVMQPCPSYVHDISRTGRAFRECGMDGIWFHPDPNTNTTSGWTNYTDCLKADPEIAAISSDLSRIELMSNIGYAFSLVSLVIAVLIMCLARRLHCKSNSLHINLFLAFIFRALASLMKDVLFVDGLALKKDVVRVSSNKVVFRQEGVHWECKLIVSIFLYTVSASMMWIFMEGLYLHMLVYKTLFTERTGIRMYVIIGWLSPFLFIIPWIMVRLFLDNTFCWNLDEHGYIWILRTPIIVTILINFVFFINIVRVLCIRMKSHTNVKGNHHQLRKLAKFSLVLIPLFGVLYIVASAYPSGVDVQADMIYLYCEMFYNSFQGCLLALLFCFLNEEVHNEVRRCWYRQRQSDNMFTRTFTLSSFRKGSYFSHSTAATGHNKNTKRVVLECPTIKENDSSEQEALADETRRKHYNSGTPNGDSKVKRYAEEDSNDQRSPLMD